MTRPSRGVGSAARRCAVALSWAALSCGAGSEIDLGAVTVQQAPTPSELPDDGRCGAEPCAVHHGTKVFIEPSAADASAELFDRGSQHEAGTDPTREPRLLYPSDETLLPVNVSRVRFAWSPGKNTLFALDFAGPNTAVRVVTRDLSWLPTPEEWDWIAESNVGAEVEVVLRALDSADANDVWRAPQRDLSFSDSALEGTIYYWSTGSAGLMRARVNEPNPVRFFTDPLGADGPTCSGCHSVSRDGKRLAVSDDKNQLTEVSLPDRSVILAAGSAVADPKPPKADPMAMMMDAGAAPDPMQMMPKPEKTGPAVPAFWSTFSPDGKLLLVAGGGKLRLLDADTGAAVGPDEGAVALPPGTIATHPDWSALGDQVVVTLASKGGDKQTEGGAIALLAYADGVFGMPVVLVANAGNMDNNFFPSFSPDSRFVAYVNATGGSQDAPSARIRLIEVATGVVHELRRLNERVADQDGVLDVGNTMPTWAPATAPGPFWLAFSSLRAYADQRPQDLKQDQLWIAAIDPGLDDPGYAAFWAPFQSIAQGNHRASWTHGDGDRQCGCVELCDDGIDNDCDGTADEPDCVTSCLDREVCGDGIDNDCDCVVDDCSLEICDDGIDNDGDGRIDKMDPACK